VNFYYKSTILIFLRESIHGNKHNVKVWSYSSNSSELLGNFCFIRSTLETKLHSSKLEERVWIICTPPVSSYSSIRHEPITVKCKLEELKWNLWTSKPSATVTLSLTLVKPCKTILIVFPTVIEAFLGYLLGIRVDWTRSSWLSESDLKVSSSKIFVHLLETKLCIPTPLRTIIICP